MSTSLLKKSLRLFEDEPKSDRLNGQKQRPGKGKRTNTTGKSPGVKRQASLKDRKVKSAIDVFVKKHLKQDKTSENLLLLEKIQKQSVVTQESANRVIQNIFMCFIHIILSLKHPFYLQDFLIPAEEDQQSHRKANS